MPEDGNGTAAEEESTRETAAATENDENEKKDEGTSETAAAKGNDENEAAEESTPQPMTGPMEVDTEPLGDTPMDEPPVTA